MTRDEIIDEVLAEMAEGEPLRRILRDNKDRGFPSKSEWYRWVEEGGPELQGRVGRARDDGFDAIADDCVEIADNCLNDWMARQKDGKKGGVEYKLNGEHIQRSKLRIETRLKLLACWDPRRYGQRVDLTSLGEKLGTPQLDEAVVAARAASILDRAARRRDEGLEPEGE